MAADFWEGGEVQSLSESISALETPEGDLLKVAWCKGFVSYFFKRSLWSWDLFLVVVSWW